MESGEKWLVNFGCDSDSRKSQGFFYMLQICEGRHAEDFSARKNLTALAGFEPTNSGTRSQHANH
jgi:hypothetical protein